MEDHQVKEISKALKDISAAIGWLALAIWMSAAWLGSCLWTSHH